MLQLDLEFGIYQRPLGYRKSATPTGLYLSGRCVAVGRPSTLATYPTFRVRVSSSVQVRTRTGRIRSVRYILYQSDRTV
uniref:Uncharacterized protein n=1 Tax=Candidatus Kentrum sp. MB TaxID=2138164 RepID=A0A450XW61_9GAMM|nr:MAG: hypothetical protein BECKMB1821I_GA0114274_104728 [Candidatus Kentron sp. MB]